MLAHKTALADDESQPNIYSYIFSCILCMENSDVLAGQHTVCICWLSETINPGPSLAPDLDGFWSPSGMQASVGPINMHGVEQPLCTPHNTIIIQQRRLAEVQD